MKCSFRIVACAAVFLVFFQLGKKEDAVAPTMNEETRSATSRARLQSIQELDFYQTLLAEEDRNDKTIDPLSAANQEPEDSSLPSNPRLALLEQATHGGGKTIEIGENWIKNDLSAARECILREMVDGSWLQRKLIITLISKAPETIRHLTNAQQMRFVREYDFNDSIKDSTIVSYFTDPSAISLLEQRKKQQMIEREFSKKRQRFQTEQRNAKTSRDHKSIFLVDHGFDFDGSNIAKTIEKFEEDIKNEQKIPLEAPNSGSSLRGQQTFANQSMADWLSKQPKAIQRTWMADVAESWSHYEPAKSLKWLESLADCREKEEAIQRSVVRWASIAPQSAISYVDTLPQSTLRERVIEDVASYYATYDYPKTVAWLNSLPPSVGVEAGKKRIGLSP